MISEDISSPPPSPSIVKSPRRIYTKNVPLNINIKIENERNLYLDKSWKEKAEKELGETNAVINSKVKLLRHLIAVSHSKVHGRTDDAFLLRFLRAKKFDTDKAYRMIQKYYTMKNESPELFRVSPPSELRPLLEMQIQCMLPLRDPNGRQVYIFRVEKCDPYKCPVESVFRSNVLALENTVRDPESQIAGLVVLLDMAGVGLGHAKFLSPHLARRTVEVIQEAFPLRFKAFHILHEPFYFDAILAVLKPFLKEKIRRRIYLHGSSLTSVHRHIPKDILPAEYGGAQPAFDNTLWRTRIINDENYFLNLENNGETETATTDDDSPINGTPTHSLTSSNGAAGIPYIDTETEDSEFEDNFYQCEERVEEIKTPILDANQMQQFSEFEAALMKSKENGCLDCKEKEVEDIK